MQYRADIDGLRAVAVGAVVLYHVFPAAMPGGYVGVDVFFVISGYLIATLIFRDLDAGRFSLLEFWERRVRRILPALLLVASVSAVAACLVFLPPDLREFGQSLVAAVAFLSNVFFWGESGYFETAAHLRPLLHTWSLAVEEQFYLVFPLLVLALWRLGRGGLGLGLGLLLAASYVVSARSAASDPQFAFYMLPSRGWELLLGVMLACLPAAIRLARPVREILAAAGLAAILVAVSGVVPMGLFPGPGALLPCLGAAAVILGGMSGGSRVGAVLSLRPFVLVGLVSYSLYLWHWPVMVFAEYVTIRELRPAEGVAVIALSVLLAALTWRFVEQPVRARRRLVRRPRLFWSAAAVSAALAVAGLQLHRSDGWPGRVPAEVQAAADPAPHIHDRRDCHFASTMSGPDALCRRGGEGAPLLLLVGDSHADMHSPAVFAAAERLGIAGLQLTDSGYLPAPGLLRAGAAPRYRTNHALLEAVLAQHPQIRLVLVGQFWDQALGYPLRARDGGAHVRGADAVGEGLAALAASHPDRRFVVIGPLPHSARFGPGAAARALARGAPVPPLPAAEAARQAARARPELDRLAPLANVMLLPVADLYCTSQGCPATGPEGLLHRDMDHLSAAGAGRLTDRFARTIAAHLDLYEDQHRAARDIRGARQEGEM